MAEKEHFTVQSQNGLFRVVETISEYGGISSMPTEYNIVNGIPSEAEAEFLCNILNNLRKENEELKKIVKQLHIDNMVLNKRYEALIDDIEEHYWK